MQGRNPKVNTGPEADVRSKPNAVNARPKPDAGLEPDAGTKPDAVNAGPEPDARPKPNAVNAGDLSVIKPSVDEVDHVVTEYTPFAFCGGSVRSSCVGGLCRGAGGRPSKASLTKTTGKSA
ncbi:hypothetical protein CRG98_013015 [Punica granatum]|uniref:Uncharacterized protein n=1 Tax=Punica granatum TaxID=22663 RepID=A0A2I0KDI1_PUNGR|nr:hypothetical protein CRG98_013015 [Punica granatum]